MSLEVIGLSWWPVCIPIYLGDCIVGGLVFFFVGLLSFMNTILGAVSLCDLVDDQLALGFTV